MGAGKHCGGRVSEIRRFRGPADAGHVDEATDQDLAFIARGPSLGLAFHRMEKTGSDALGGERRKAQSNAPESSLDRYDRLAAVAINVGKRWLGNLDSNQD